MFSYTVSKLAVLRQVTRLACALTLFIAWSLGWLSASAQVWPPLEGVVSDNTASVDAGQVNSAAGELQALGVKPLAVFARDLPSSFSIEQYARSAVANYNLGTSSQPDPQLLAIVVTLNPHNSIILYGDGLRPAMEQARGGGTLADSLRTGYLNPGLAGGDYTKAFSDTFRQAAKEINLYRNPPPAPTPVPAVVTNIDTNGLGRSLLLCIGGLAVLAALAVAVPLIWRQRKRGQEVAARRRSLQEQLVQARNVAADMITNLDFPADPAEQIQYRFLALALGKERPEQLTQITEQYHQAYDRLAQALTLYNNLSQSTPATEEQLNAAIGQYQQVQTEVKNAGAFLQWLADQSREVETQSTAAPGEIDAAKKAIAAATDEISRLAAAAPDLYAVQPARALKPAMDRITEAQRSAQAQPPLLLRAYEYATSAHSLVQVVLDSLKKLSDASVALSRQRAKLQQARSQGYKLPNSDADMEAGSALLSEAARHLEEGNGPAFADTLQHWTESIQQAGAVIDQAAALHSANDKALAQLQVDGDEVRKLIQQGVQAFDRVDEYAESSWQDIRGNGTEAQRAADQAFRLWQEAGTLNALSTESKQDFTGAQTRIEQANRHLARAKELVTAIMERLKNLQESQRTAQEEIAAAQADIETGSAYISRYDPDISRQPADMLQKAGEAVSQAKEETQNAKPDWIRVVALARQANDLADKALADARSQEEAMQARRLKLKTVAQQTQASLSKAANFASVHRADLDDTIMTALADAQAKAQAASEVAGRGEQSGVEDTERAQMLDKAIAAFVSAQQEAESAYNSAASQFAAVDALRQRAYGAYQQADQTISSVTNYIQSNGRVISRQSRQLLDEAVGNMPQWRDGASSETLQAIASQAAQAQHLAEQAYASANQDVDAYNQQQGGDVLSSVLAAGVLDSILSSGGRQSSGGWGGSWGGGGSHGGWGGGGGGSSSGGWGGGGSSGGSWGGGGSSGGGSWGGGGSSSGGW